MDAKTCYKRVYIQAYLTSNLNTIQQRNSRVGRDESLVCLGVDFWSGAKHGRKVGYQTTASDGAGEEQPAKSEPEYSHWWCCWWLLDKYSRLVLYQNLATLWVEPCDLRRCKYGDPVGGLDVATCRNFFGRQARPAPRCYRVIPPKMPTARDILHGTWEWWFPEGISFSRDLFSNSALEFRGVQCNLQFLDFLDAHPTIGWILLMTNSKGFFWRS